MKKIPADIDQLMWTIAEEGDPRTLEDFEQRFPDFKYELGKRVLLLRQLRGARQPGAPHPNIPRFEPRIPQPMPWRRTAWAAATFVALACIAWASYSLTKMYVSTSQDRLTAVDLGSPRQAPPDNLLPSRPLPAETDPQPKEQDLVPSAYQKKITIQIDRAALLDAIARVGREGGLDLQIGPGMDNPDVTMAYYDMSGIAILEDMGKQLGFTPFYEGDGKVLIVPAVDPKRRNDAGTAQGTAHVVEDAPHAKPPANGSTKAALPAPSPAHR